MPVHIVVDYSFWEEPVIVTSYVPSSRYWIKKRKCPECGGEMEAKLINLSYKREGVDLEVEVIGIPANVCTKCFYRIIPGKVAKYIDSLVGPLFESEIRCKEKLLPSPHAGIQFPFLDRNTYAGL